MNSPLLRLLPSRAILAVHCLWPIALIAAAAPAPTRPNLLIIQTDEHNFRTLGAYRALLPKEQAFVWGDGIKVDTPHLDWIAQHGAIADRYYATSPVCTPSRASFLTGHYPQNTGAIQNDLPMRDDMVTFAEVLRGNGYATGYAGKWHLDGGGKPQFAPARKFGFEDNRYMFNRGHWKNLAEDARGPRVGAVDRSGAPTYAVDGADEKSFTTDFLTDRTIDFLRRNTARPFCWMLSIPDPHGPNTVRAPYDTMFLDLKFEQPRSARSPGRNLPGYAATLAGAFNQVQMARYFGMVKCIDDNVGRILATLRETGLLERTVVVFTSDHGDLCGEHGRDNKGVPMEGSSRVPFLIYAPGVVKPGTIIREALGTVDFKPTILSLLGVANPQRDQGRDAAALFREGRAPAGWKDIAFLRIGGGNARLANSEDGENPAGSGWIAAFSRRYKFVVAPAASAALFDLEDDPDELTNLVDSPAHREIVRQFGRELLEYANTFSEPLLKTARVRADLAWAVSDVREYVAAPESAGAAGRRNKGAGKKKAGTK
jgi:arylsulfatase A-like enzyme